MIAGERTLDLGELSAGVAELDSLRRLGSRESDEPPLVSARHYALDRLLARIGDTHEAHDFVREQIGRLIAWDREHRGDLLTVLEAALDQPRHEDAATRCFMHRNTFRHRYRQATEILDQSLEDPDVRLAVHVALKLRKVLARPASDDVSVPRRADAAPRRAPRATERHRGPVSRR